VSAAGCIEREFFFGFAEDAGKRAALLAVAAEALADSLASGTSQHSEFPATKS
jgi:hypothetical protein